ncbi:hypothetical protein DACRYDRAFT_112205 [Dacryopinax primogenitus]|uniref:Uncharacterized protein n=1 Tax=Dacryopinax primogenitus (strain DJM 731) TaxID=1858805 RepID=M5FN57_DACPD|nr:uncharacterized protein DACRYDRAFT_112205 [Dacryopinax primogenitus]EJT96865.1 hypothetical protein DACRYDRAFT_112205 [Dacryopinax primogenitus]
MPSAPAEAAHDGEAQGGCFNWAHVLKLMAVDKAEGDIAATATGIANISSAAADKASASVGGLPNASTEKGVPVTNTMHIQEGTAHDLGDGEEDEDEYEASDYGVEDAIFMDEEASIGTGVPMTEISPVTAAPAAGPRMAPLKKTRKQNHAKKDHKYLCLQQGYVRATQAD